MSTLVWHRVDCGRDLAVDTIRGGYGPVGPMPGSKLSARTTRLRPRGHEPSVAPREVAPPGPGWVIVLGFVAPVGLALLVTTGFASALALYAGLAVLSPNMIRACEGVFLWTLALVSFESCE